MRGLRFLPPCTGGSRRSPEDIFSEDYACFSSFSESWLAPCRRYVDMVVAAFSLGPASKAVDIASNDCCRLQYMIAAGVRSLGVEPAASVADAARTNSVPTEIDFFSEATARRVVAEGHADLLVSRNVLAYVPDINDFVAGAAAILNPEGVYTIEFPHLLKLIQKVHFDMIYHEHFTCLSDRTQIRDISNVGGRYGTPFTQCRSSAARLVE